VCPSHEMGTLMTGFSWPNSEWVPNRFEDVSWIRSV